MEEEGLSRRALLRGGGAAVAGLTVLRMSAVAAAAERPIGGDGSFDAASAESTAEADGALRHFGGEVVPWLDQPAPVPPPAQEVIGHQLVWEDLSSWITPNDQFFTVKHYGEPGPLDPATHRVSISGLVSHPLALSLADLKARGRRGVDFTLECAGNSGLPFFTGGVGNARWVGTPLAPLLRHAVVDPAATEVVFWGADAGPVTIRDNAGAPGAAEGGLVVTEQFARSMSLTDAMNPNNLLCYEMNGEPLPPEHGAPVRLIAPGWYGVANVKWLSHIEVTDRRHAGRFMARDYVTIREEQRGGETVWTFATVGHDRLMSAPAKVTRRDGRHRVLVAAWGAPIKMVEVSVDGGPWQEATLVTPRAPSRWSRRFAWSFWSLDWGTPTTGQHSVTSRAHDVHGNVQPAPTDPILASKRTYWESNGQITRHVVT